MIWGTRGDSWLMFDFITAGTSIHDPSCSSAAVVPTVHKTQEIGWLFASLSRQPTLPQQQQPAAAVLAAGCEKSQGHSAGMLASRNGPSYRAATAVDTVNSAAIHERIHSVHCTAVQLYSYGVLRSTAVVPKEIGLQLRESLAPTGTRSYGYPLLRVLTATGTPYR